MSILVSVYITSALFTLILRLLSSESLFWTQTQYVPSYFISFYDLKDVFSQNSHVGVPVPNVMMLEGEAFGRGWGHEGGAFVNEISGLLRRNPTGLPSSFHHAML